jgi:hypothetical protein
MKSLFIRDKLKRFLSFMLIFLIASRLFAGVSGISLSVAADRTALKDGLVIFASISVDSDEQEDEDKGERCDDCREPIKDCECDGVVVVIPSDTPQTVYQHNSRIFGSRTTDPVMLEFYTLPTRNNNIKSNHAEITALADSITKSITNDVEKAKAISKWVSDNIYYDRDSISSGNRGDNTALGTLKNKRATCEGYSNLTIALLRAVGIPARYVRGFAMGVGGSAKPQIFNDVNSTEVNHAWTEAFAGSKWIIIDTTWNSQNRYENERFVAGNSIDIFWDISKPGISSLHFRILAMYSSPAFTMP